MKNKALTAAFCVFLLAFSSLFFLAPKAAFSPNENRYLAKLPELTQSSLLNGSFMAGLDEYVSDHFPLRDAWVSLKTNADLALGRKDSGGVYITRDGFLIDMFTQVDTDRYRRNLAQVQALFQQAESLSVDTSLMLVPTASGILKDLLPANAPEVDQQALFQQAESLLPLTDVSAALLAHSDEYVYYRTDHHWTSLGAYYAYAVWAEAAGLPAHDPEDYSSEILASDFYGTTFSKSGYYGAPADQITAMFLDLPYTVEYSSAPPSHSLYETSHLGKKDKYPVFLGGNQPVTKITGGPQNGRKLLIVKDSYANTFAQFAAGDFEEVHMIDPRYYRASLIDYVQTNGITDLLVLYNVKNFAEDKNLTALQS